MAVSTALHAALICALVFLWPGHRERLVRAPKVMSVFIPQLVQAPVEPPRPRPVAPASKPRPAPTAPAPVTAMPALAPMEMPVASPIARSETVATQPMAPPAEAAPPVAVPAITPPRHDAAYLSNPPPRYPPIARRNGEQGRVLLRVLVTTEGLAETIEIRTSSGSERLDRAALETVRSWRFVPARQGERAVSAWVLVPITFSLDS
jgi:periplasmic protein TonB